MRNSVECSLCGRGVSAVRNWARWQSGQSPEWRVVRHRATEGRAPKGTRETICRGSGILVTQDAVTREGVPA